MACRACRTAKRACEWPLPCRRCYTHGLQDSCAVPPPAAHRGRPRKQKREEEEEEEIQDKEEEVDEKEEKRPSFSKDESHFAAPRSPKMRQPAFSSVAATAAADIFSLDSDDFFNFSPDLTAFDLLAFQGEETARQNQAMLSVLLSPEGAGAFLSRPAALAAAFGIALEGRSWVLVQYPPGACAAADMMSGVVAAVGGEAWREIVGRDMASIGFVYSEQRMRAVLFSEKGNGKCFVGTAFQNDRFIRKDGRELSLRTAYIFFNEAGVARFMFTVVAEQTLPLVGVKTLDDSKEVVHVALF